MKETGIEHSVRFYWDNVMGNIVQAEAKELTGYLQAVLDIQPTLES